ncbi:MAG: Fic family protein [Spirochaetia bacterium]|jgi:Fic family protein|nr:Fic family protein [Spirochaetia bacterium]
MRSFDYSRLADSKLDSQTISYIAQIHEAKGKQELYATQKTEMLDRLVEVAKRQSTESSNAIEGIRTTTSRLAQICAEKTTPRNRDEKEIAGYRDVLNTIHSNYEFIPLKPSYILQLHRDLMQYADVGFGGKFKDSQNEINTFDADGKRWIAFLPTAPYEIPGAIEAICENYNRAVGNHIVEPLILIPVFILDFLCIHPFNDGNGRMSRLLTTLLLYKAGFNVGRYISLESKISKTKDAYYDTLSASDQGWNIGENNPLPFIKYLLGTILAAYRDLDDRMTLASEKTNSLGQVRRAVESVIGRFTKRQIMDIVPSAGKSSIENALKSLVEEGFIIRSGVGRATFYVRADSQESPK